MPMVYGAAAGSSKAKFLDFNNQEGTINIPAGDLTKLQAGLELFNKISNASITEVETSSVLPVTSGANVPVFGGQREHWMGFDVVLADGKETVWELPSPNETILFAAEKTLLDLSQADLAAFIAWAVLPANGVTLPGKNGLRSQVKLITKGWVFHKASKLVTKKTRRG
jgi:hypothetical protein